MSAIIDLSSLKRDGAVRAGARLDFSSSFGFATMFGWSDMVPQLTGDVINLFDKEQRQYFQFPNATFTQYEPGRTVIVGLRGRF